jgi:glycosyltransferase involved in cell wall biosynthesis
VTAPMRIGIDARELLGQTTGVGRYLAELLRRWNTRSDANSRQFILYSPEPLHTVFTAGNETRVLPGGRGTWWEQTALRPAVRQDKPDIFFAPAYTAPVNISTRFAVTIHDVSFIAHPEWFRPREQWRRRILTTRAARAASVILTDSEFSRREIEQYIRVPSDRLKVIPPGVALPSRPREAVSREPRDPLVLFVGSLFNRRRLPDLIAAFARATASRPDARLVVVGANRTWPAQDLRGEAERAGVAEKTQIVDYIDEGGLATLYARASAFAFLSEYEGFGLTPLEALAAGVPIVVLDTEVAREVYGPAAEYVPCGDIDAAAAAIGRFLHSPAAARQQLAFAPDVLARYSWDRAADETLAQLEGIAR